MYTGQLLAYPAEFSQINEVAAVHIVHPEGNFKLSSGLQTKYIHEIATGQNLRD